jgi:hypothetical protein
VRPCAEVSAPIYLILAWQTKALIVNVYIHFYIMCGQGIRAHPALKPLVFCHAAL